MNGTAVGVKVDLGPWVMGVKPIPLGAAVKVILAGCDPSDRDAARVASGLSAYLWRVHEDDVMRAVERMRA